MSKTYTRLALRCFRWVTARSRWSRVLDQRRKVQSGSPRGARAFITYVLRLKISIPPWTNFAARVSNSYMTPRSWAMGSVASRLSTHPAPATSYSNWQNLLDRKPSKGLGRRQFLQLPNLAVLSPVRQRFDDCTQRFNENLRQGAQRPIHQRQ